MINVPYPELLGQICRDNFIYDPIQDPLTTFASFFGDRNLQGHLKRLKQWKNALLSYDYLEVSTVYHPLHEHKLLCNLLNAAWLLTKSERNDQLAKSLATAQDAFLSRECLQHEFYVKHLSRTELLDPLAGLAHFFESFALQDAHRLLYNWLNTALSPNVMLDVEETALFYRHLRRLIECCWLIFIRNENESEGMKNVAAEPDKEPINEVQHSEEIAPNVLSGFQQFLSVVPAQRLNRGLRKMLIDYLFYNMGGLPTDFEDTLSDFYWLTDLLDEIQGKDVDPKFM
ncbi:MAG: hypothetical protein REI78_08690 [Pedobacter sp.]|nr:hypothetical protein [Pedobacter sp.]MDQ8053092.1 hypothetical protein [Pedobacter sp.]